MQGAELGILMASNVSFIIQPRGCCWTSFKNSKKAPFKQGGGRCPKIARAPSITAVLVMNPIPDTLRRGERTGGGV
jgi:hypothetical protein